MKSHKRSTLTHYLVKLVGSSAPTIKPWDIICTVFSVRKKLTYGQPTHSWLRLVVCQQAHRWQTTECHRAMHAAHRPSCTIQHVIMRNYRNWYATSNKVAIQKYRLFQKSCVCLFVFMLTRSPAAVARMADHTSSQWPSRSMICRQFESQYRYAISY